LSHFTDKAPGKEPRSLLIIDDDRDLREFFIRSLADSRYKIYEVADCHSGLEMMDAGLVPDLIILDLMLPGMSGMEFLSMARKRYPKLKTIVISADGQVDTVVEAMRLGAIDFIRKPFDMDEVQVAVNDAIHLKEIEEEMERRKRKRTFQDEIPFLYASREMAAIMEMIQQAAPTSVPVLITGESGVGKEVVAREIHHRSAQVRGSFVKVNCAALPSTLLESELFGFEKGAFTGAVQSKKAKFEKANDGTIFLDEIGEMDPSIQAKLLHVLQDGTFSRLGSNKLIRSNARVIIATNRDLEAAVSSGEFRADLYFRLNVIRIHVPALRERISDIPMLARHFMNVCNQKFHKDLVLDDDTIRLLESYEWPGNVRELHNAISRFAVLGQLELGKRVVTPGDMADTSAPETVAATPAGKEQPAGPVKAEKVSLKEIGKKAAREAEREAIQAALEITRWNKAKAARLLKISYKAFLYKARQCGITDPGKQ
jgi:two-component system response regulator AtoC